MTTINSLLNIEDLTLSIETPSFDDSFATMHFTNILKGGRKLQLRIYGTITSGLMENGVYGDSFFFTPSDEDRDNLIAIENMAVERVPKNYTLQTALIGAYQLGIKLKTNALGKYRATLPFTYENVGEALVRGKKCVIDVTPGFYFSNDVKNGKKNYGVFYTLKSLKWSDVKITTKGTKAASKRK